MKQPVPNQLYRDLLSTTSLNPWPGHDSSPRMTMFASSHLSQALVVKGATERRHQTGMEREFGKYTFSVKMPVDAEIIKVINRYRPTYDQNAIAENPQSVVLYENVATKEVGMLSLQNYCSQHQYFGFEYVKRPAFANLRQGAFIEGGTIFQDSPNVTPDGGYKYGVECNVALMTHPAVSEDGILISRDVLPRFAFKTYERRLVEWGSKRFPLNLYGDADNYKPFPDIGDRIRPDGLLMALRGYDDELSVVEQSAQDLREPDFIFDKCFYVAGAGGRVIDIIAHHDPDAPKITTPLGMETQAIRYDRARRQFYSELLSELHRLRRDRGEALNLTPELHRMMVEAISVQSDPKGKRVQKLYRQAPLDDWRLEFVVEYDVVPTIGFKATGCHGNKGVICHVAEPHEMPVDDAGNRADIVMDPYSVISRMNMGVSIEQYLGAASRDVTFRVQDMLGFGRNVRVSEQQVSDFAARNPEKFKVAWDHLLGYYEIVSPKMFVWFTTGAYPASPAAHVTSVINKGVYSYIPTDNSPEMETIIAQCEKFYRPTYGPVTYVGNSGQRVRTKVPVRIGSMYIILLEKTGDDWTAVSSGKLQHFGVLSQVTNADKYSQPTREQAIRALGESEIRIYVSYAGPLITADIMDRNNNPAAHRQVLESLLNADRPTHIQTAINRTEVALGGSKPLQLVRHIQECSGMKLVYRPHIPTPRHTAPQHLVEDIALDPKALRY